MGYTKAERHRGGFFYRARGLMLLCPLIFLCLSCDNPVLKDELAGHNDGAERMMNDPAETYPGASYAVVNVPADLAAYKIENSMRSDIRYSFVLSGKLTNACIIAIRGALDPKEYNNVNIALDMRECTELEELPVEAFEDCKTLTSVAIPSGVTSIGKGAFKGCSGLTSVDIPSGVTDIGDSAFEGCSGLTSVSIPYTVTRIGEGAFKGCSGLSSLLDIPSSVLHIGNSAFKGCSSLRMAMISTSVTDIGHKAFKDCSKLLMVVIPGTVTVIGDYAFCNCSTLMGMEFLAGKNASIGEGAFCGCTGLTSVTIPAGVTSIGKRAFSNCTGLTSLAFSAQSVWYRTSSKIDWQNKTGGTEVDLFDPVTNVAMFTTDNYWYK